MFSDLFNNDVLMSVLFISAVLLVRFVGLRILEHTKPNKNRNNGHWHNTITNIATFIILVGLAGIWVNELKYVAFSIAAFIVALVIATREVIQSVLGFVYISTKRLFSVGDWIQLDGIAGQVLRYDWLSTRIVAIDPLSSYKLTGEIKDIPNNVFLTKSVSNISIKRHYIAHTFEIIREPSDIDLFAIRDQLITKARAYCSEFQEVARRYNAHLENKIGGVLVGPEPDISIGTTELGKDLLHVSIYCPTASAIEIEQQLIRDFATQFRAANNTPNT